MILRNEYDPIKWGGTTQRGKTIVHNDHKGNSYMTNMGFRMTVILH